MSHQIAVTARHNTVTIIILAGCSMPGKQKGGGSRSHHPQIREFESERIFVERDLAESITDLGENRRVLGLICVFDLNPMLLNPL